MQDWRHKLGLWFLNNPWPNILFTFSLWVMYSVLFNVWGFILYIVVFFGWGFIYDQVLCVRAAANERDTNYDEKERATLWMAWTGQYLATLMFPLTLWATGLVLALTNPHFREVGCLIRSLFESVPCF